MKEFFHALGFHQWGAWSEPEPGKARPSAWSEWEDASIQIRVCSVCNIQEVRRAIDAGPVAPGSMDARTLMKLPKEERERLLEQAAALTQHDYDTAGGALTGFDALDEEDHRDKPFED